MYIKNIDISKKYRLSRPTITRWIDLAKAGKNNLQIKLINNKDRILDNPHNWAEIERLANISEKYKYSHTEGLKIVDIEERFYNIYNTEEIAEIYNNLETKKEVADKFIYKDEGAQIWDEFYSENEISKLWSIPDIVEDLLIQNIVNLNYYTDNYKINIFDLGPGNSQPVKKYIKELINIDKIEKYIGVDISPDMLHISENNITKWFPDLKYDKFVCDLENVNFHNYFLKQKDTDIINVILHTGGTISNHNDRLKVIKNIRNAMGIQDIFIFSCTLDTISTRAELNHMQTEEADKQDIFVPKILGIDVDSCGFEVSFDHTNRRKIKTLKLDKDYIINFKIDDKIKPIRLYKNDAIIVWQHYLFDLVSLVQELDVLDLNPTTIIQDKSGKQALLLCTIKKIH